MTKNKRAMLKRFAYPRDEKCLRRLWERSPANDPKLDRSVGEIIEAVRRRGDRAVAEFTRRFDGVTLKPAQFRVPPQRLKEAWDSLPGEVKAALKAAHERIKRFHARQKRQGVALRDSLGVILQERVTPLGSVGLYVPGGKAAYPSTVLMCAVPAFVAGVRRVVMVTPPHNAHDLANRATWGAAWLAGVREVYGVGGAQAVAALAFGTAAIPRVDKVVGPGNKYVATAKRLLYGRIDIDSVAGPSEVMILADETARPDLIAADMMAQAEHDEAASAILVVIGKDAVARRLAGAVEKELRARIAKAPRRAIIRASLRRNGAVISVPSPLMAAQLADQRAPEHLEIMTRAPRNLAGLVSNAGAIFIGAWTPEAFGDYVAGPNHTLPTGGTARFFSPLGVGDFVKTNNVIEASRKALVSLAPVAVVLAGLEGLAAHAESLRLRLKQRKSARK